MSKKQFNQVWNIIFTSITIVKTQANKDTPQKNRSWNLAKSYSQPGCCGTLGCREKVPGVPPNFGFAKVLSQT